MRTDPPRPRRNRAALTAALCFAAVASVGVLAWRAYAGPNVPQGIAYSGELLNNGTPDNAMHNFTFALFDVAGGNPLCTDGPRSVTVAAGRFDVASLFGANCALDTILATKTGLQLQITVDNNILAPMQPFGTVPFAARARVAEALEVPEVPSGAVMYFNLQACPAGWTALVPAQGRYLVGVPAGGTLGGTDGTPLADKEDRPAGQHGHGVTDPGHTHSTVVSLKANTYPTGGYSGGGGSSPWPATDMTGTATTGVTVGSFGNIAGTNAPYLQLLVCQKN